MNIGGRIETDYLVWLVAVHFSASGRNKATPQIDCELQNCVGRVGGEQSVTCFAPFELPLRPLPLRDVPNNDERLAKLADGIERSPGRLGSNIAAVSEPQPVAPWLRPCRHRCARLRGYEPSRRRRRDASGCMAQPVSQAGET
jgi:hypothetical protein